MKYIFTQKQLILIFTLKKESIQNPLESIAMCGMFIKNTKHSSILYRDIFENSIHTIYFHNPSLQSLIIQTSNDSDFIVPYIYKSMRVDCFLDIHLNFDPSKRTRPYELYL